MANMNQILSVPYNLILQALQFLYPLCFNNLGLAIIVLTILIRLILVPLTLKQTKTQKKMNDLKPKIDELKTQHKGDKLKLQEAQMKLYQEHGVNPLGGCLPMIVQLVVLIALYQVFSKFLGPHATIGGKLVNTQFFWLNLAKHDQFYILPILAGVTQLVMSKMMMPTKPLQIKKSDTKEEKEEKLDFAEAMQEAQSQMVYTMPIMTTIISINFPAGLALYWIVGNICSIIQQYLIAGWGGLQDFFIWKKKEMQIKKQ
jgi:YidC/Oxa1 family membrane protein insertase